MDANLQSQLEQFLDGEWTYGHWPEFHAIKDYHRVEQQYLTRCVSNPSVRSVWRVGEVGVPGISDLDFVLGLKEPVDATTRDSLSILQLGAPGDYVAFHQPLLFSEALLRALFFWGSVSPPTCLYGDPDAVGTLTREQSRLMAIVSLNDILVQSQPRTILRTLLTRTVHVRGTLCQINALRHMLRLFREATGLDTTRWDSLMQEFAQFRQSWFDLGSDRVDRLRVYIVKSVIMLFEVMATYSRALSSQKWFQYHDSRADAYFLASDMRTRFSIQWDPEMALVHTLSEWKRSCRLILDLPYGFAEPLRSYLDETGLLSAHVKQYLWSSHRISPTPWRRDITNAAARHVRIRNSHVAFLFRNGLLWRDANYSSLGLWPHILTDNSLRGYLRRLYHWSRKLIEVAEISC